MKKIILLFLLILVVSCASNNSRKEVSDNDSVSEQTIESSMDQVASDADTSTYEEEKSDILEPGVTYITTNSASDTDIFGGDVNLKVEFTIYYDGSAKCTLIETNSEDFYDNTNSYEYSLDGEWEEISKQDKRFVQIEFTLETDDYYKEFTYFIDEELNAYAEDINTTAVKLVKKTETKSVSTPSVQDIPFIPMVVKSNPLTFTCSSFVNSNKAYPVSGIWCPAEVEKHSIMCISNGQQDPYRKYFYIFNKEQSDIWTNSFTGLKELFISYENIAKENGVTTDIQKEVTDKFEFAGQYGSQTIVKEYNWENDETVQIRPIYLFKNNVSSIEVYVEDFYLHKVSLLWTFRNVQDFDELINAINWERFMAEKNEQVQRYTAEQNALKAAEDKAQKERELFN